MTNSEFINILNDESLELTVEELENIIDEELQKDESEMDPDLIEYCLYYIDKAETNNGKGEKYESDKAKPKTTHLNSKLKKVLIIAATIALLLVTSGIAAIATDKEIKNSAVTFYENHIRVHFNRSKDTDTISGIKIATELKKHGIADLKLPSIFFSNDCIYENMAEDNVDDIKDINISYRVNGISGRLFISKFHSKEIIPSVDFQNTTNYSKVEELSVNGITVYVIKQTDFCSIAYQDSLTQYVIYLDTNFADAIEIAKTISDMEA